MSKVLFVDDEEMILRSLKRQLRNEGYEQFYCSDGNEALEILSRESIDVLVTDMRMPLMNGLELLEIVKEIYPNIVKIVLSGYTQVPQMLVTINKGDIFRFITKPWDFDGELVRAINDALNHSKELLNSEMKNKELESKNILFQKILSRFNVRKEGIISDVDLLARVQDVVAVRVNELTKQVCHVPEKEQSLCIEEINRLMRFQKKLLLEFPFERDAINYKKIMENIKKRTEKDYPKVAVEVQYPDVDVNEVFGITNLLPLVIEDLLEMHSVTGVVHKICYIVNGDLNLTKGTKEGRKIDIITKLYSDYCIKADNVESAIQSFNDMFKDKIKLHYERKSYGVVLIVRWMLM